MLTMRYGRGLLLLALAALPACSGPVADDQEASEPASDAAGIEHGEAEGRPRPEAARWATGEFDYARIIPSRKWPVHVLSIGHTNASYQNYGDGSPYFHHGLDIRADAGSDVVAAAGGKVVNIENYMPGSAYWEIAIQDDDGFLWQYHHVDHDSIPQQIHDALRSGQKIAEGTKLGEVFYWSVVTFGERYHHIHLNVLGAGGKYISPFEFLEPLPDTQAPQFVDVGLLKSGRKVSGTTVSGNYSVYAEVHDLIMHQKFVVPPHKLTYKVDGGEPVTVWEFHELPGGADHDKFVDNFFVPSLACGDYECRKLYVDLGFGTAGPRYFTGARGQHSVEITASDFAGNSAAKSFTWSVQ